MSHPFVNNVSISASVVGKTLKLNAVASSVVSMSCIKVICKLCESKDAIPVTLFNEFVFLY